MGVVANVFAAEVGCVEQVEQGHGLVDLVGKLDSIVGHLFAEMET